MFKILKLKKLLITFTIALIALGINSFYNIPKQENPDLGSLNTNIVINAVGMNSEEIDKEIVEVINTQISGIEGLGEVFSYSYDNFGLIVIVYDLNVENVEEVEVQLNTAVKNIQFDDNIKIEVEPNAGISDILYVFPTKDINKAYEFQNELYKLDSVNKVSISENNLPYYKLNIDNNQLITMGLDSTKIIELLASKGVNATLGMIEGSPIVTANKFTSEDDIKNIVVGNSPQGIITLGMISNIELVETKDYTNTYNGEESLFMSVQFDKNIDVTKVGDDIKNIQKDYKNFEAISFAPDYVDDSINEINSTLLVGMILVLIVSIFSLGIRGALTILITFPLTVFATILFLDLVNIPLQNISIAGLIISIGIIVDNAIVIVDAIIHELESGVKMDVSIKRSIKNNTIPIFTSTLTTIVAFTPLLFLPGVAGKMASSLPVTVIAALICSFFSAIFIIPIFAEKFLKPRNRNEWKFVDKLIKISLRFPRTNVLLVLILLVVSVGSVYINQPVQLFPSAQKDYIYIDYVVNDSNDIKEVEKIGKTIEDNIKSDNVVSAVNYTIPTFYTTLAPNTQTPNAGRVIYTNKSNNEKEIARIKEVLNKELKDNVTFNVSQIMMNAPGAPIQVVLYDIDKTEDVLKQLNKVSGVESIQTTKSANTNKYDIVANKQFILQNGLNEGQIFNEIAKLINDQKIDVIDQENIDDNLTVSNNIKDLELLKTQSINLNDKVYALNDLVTIQTIESPVSVQRTDYKVASTLNIYVDSNYGVYEVHDDVVNILDKNNVDYNTKGEKELTTTVFTDVIIAGIAALILILLILLAQFNNFKNVLIILTSILFSFIGSALFIMIFDQPITFTATLGLVSLMGIVVNNGILLVDYIEKNQSESMYDKCHYAVKRRSRPIITSNVTTIIGLIPLIVVGSDFFRPMAITLVGGLVVAIPLSLCVIPSLYLIFNKDK